jgi:hypothetical protein
MEIIPWQVGRLAISVAAILSLASLPMARDTPPVAEARTVPLEERMRAFLEAVRQSDVEGILQYFPRHGEIRYLHTVHERQGARASTWIFPAADAREAIEDGPLWASFVIQPEGQPIGLFKHQMMLRGTDWRRVRGTRFVPPGGDASSGIFVEWRREDSEWVVSAFGDERYFWEPLPEWCC